MQQSERFYNAISEMRRYLMQAKPFSGITHSEVAVLHMIEMCEKQGKRASTTWMSARMNLSKSSISQTLGAMEEKGWIIRTIDPNNRRQTAIGITEEGRLKMDEVNAAVLVSIDRMLERMGQENAERFVELMELYLASVKIEFQRKDSNDGFCGKSESH